MSKKKYFYIFIFAFSLAFIICYIDHKVREKKIYFHYEEFKKHAKAYKSSNEHLKELLHHRKILVEQRFFLHHTVTLENLTPHSKLVKDYLSTSFSSEDGYIKMTEEPKTIEIWAQKDKLLTVVKALKQYDVNAEIIKPKTITNTNSK